MKRASGFLIFAGVVAVLSLGIFIGRRVDLPSQSLIPHKSLSTTAASSQPATAAAAKAFVPKNHKLSPEQCWARVNAQIGESDDYEKKIDGAMGDLVDPWLYQRDAEIDIVRVQTAPNLFLSGLARAGFLIGKRTTRDDEAALELLEKAHELDPENSAPLLYAALIEKRRGNLGASQQIVQEAVLSGERFDSYITTLAKASFGSIVTPVDYLSAVAVSSALPVPNYMELKKILQGSAAVAVGKQLMQDGLNPKKKIEMVDYVSIEYANGYNLLKGKVDTDSYPTLKELWKKKKDGRLSRIFDAANTALEQSCDISALDPYLAQIRAIYQTE